jgi:hypothetical protein
MGGFPWADHHHDAGGRVVEAGVEDSQEVSATDLPHCDWCGAGSVLAHDAKVRQVPVGLLLMERRSEGRIEPGQSRVHAQAQHGRRDDGA